MNDAMYESLLNRLYSKIQSVTNKDAFRLELPQPDVDMVLVIGLC